MKLAAMGFTSFTATGLAEEVLTTSPVMSAMKDVGLPSDLADEVCGGELSVHQIPCAVKRPPRMATQCRRSGEPRARAGALQRRAPR
jgi:hypothetical protein